MDYRQLATIICLHNPCHAVSPLTRQLELPRVHLHTQTLTNRQFVKSGTTRDWTLSHWIRLESNRVSGFACATTALLTRWILTTELRSLWPTVRSRVAVPEPLQGKGCYPLIPYRQLQLDLAPYYILFIYFINIPSPQQVLRCYSATASIQNAYSLFGILKPYQDPLQLWQIWYRCAWTHCVEQRGLVRGPDFGLPQLSCLA